MPSRPVVPNHFPGNQRCHKHPDRIAQQIRSGQALCGECASERDRQLFRENFYGPPPDPDLEALGQRLEVVESQLQHQPLSSKAAPGELMQSTKLRRKRRGFTSPLKIAVRTALISKPGMQNPELRSWLDDHLPEQVKERFKDDKNPRGSIVTAYATNAKHRHVIEVAITQVRKDMDLPATQRLSS